MKRILLIALFFANNCFGQDFKFETVYFDAVDKWVAFDKEGDSTYMLGFIYIDEQAGFTFDFESRFNVNENKLEKLPRDFESSLKIRLSSKTANVHILTSEEILQLGLSSVPEWLEHYKSNQNKASYYKNIGYHYNHVGASKNAIIPLLQGYSLDPHYKGLEFELAYAYNATKKYDSAIVILTKAIENDSKNFWFFRELGYSYKNLGKLDKAEEVYKQGISMSDLNEQKAEMAINMAQSYFQIKNKAKFEEWADIAKQYTEKGSQFDKYIEYWEKNWDKE